MQKRPILIIDDDPSLCETAAAMLVDAGFEVLSAPDGPSGIETARVAQPAVIILDMMMPGVDGIETCELLKRDPVLGDIPVIGATGSEDLTYTKKAFRAGAQFFLPKPFGTATLIQVVELALESARHHTPLEGRRHPRFPAEVPIRCFVSADANTAREVRGHTQNVSLGGLLLLLAEKLESGMVLRLRLGLPEGAVSADGTVMWQAPQPTGEGKTLHGIRLLRFTEDAGLVQYRRFLSQLAADYAARTNP